MATKSQLEKRLAEKKSRLNFLDKYDTDIKTDTDTGSETNTDGNTDTEINIDTNTSTDIENDTNTELMDMIHEPESVLEVISIPVSKVTSKSKSELESELISIRKLESELISRLKSEQILKPIFISKTPSDLAATVTAVKDRRRKTRRSCLLTQEELIVVGELHDRFPDVNQHRFYGLGLLLVHELLIKGDTKEQMLETAHKIFLG